MLFANHLYLPKWSCRVIKLRQNQKKSQLKTKKGNLVSPVGRYCFYFLGVKMLCCEDLQFPSAFETKLPAFPDDKQKVITGSVVCPNDKHRGPGHHWYNLEQMEMLCNTVVVLKFIEKHISLQYYTVSQFLFFPKTPNFTRTSFLRWPQLFIQIFTHTVLWFALLYFVRSWRWKVFWNLFTARRGWPMRAWAWQHTRGEKPGLRTQIIIES